MRYSIKDIKLPNYKDPNYNYGNYDNFSYATGLDRQNALAFMSTQSREKIMNTAYTRLDLLTIKGFIPATDQRSFKTDTRIIKREQLHSTDLTDVSELREMWSLLDQVRGVRLPTQFKKPVMNKNGLLWGTGHKSILPKLGPGPGAYDVIKTVDKTRNRVPFNSTAEARQPNTTKTPLGHINLNPVKAYQGMLHHSFGGKPKLNLPLVLHVGVDKDNCLKCKRQIWGKYFYYLKGKFICSKCAKQIHRGRDLQEKIQLSTFQYGRYCWRYHKHSRSGAYEMLIPMELLDYTMRQEMRMSYIPREGKLVEGEQKQKRWERGRVGGDIYHLLNIGTDWTYLTSHSGRLSVPVQTAITYSTVCKEQ